MVSQFTSFFIMMSIFTQLTAASETSKWEVTSKNSILLTMNVTPDSFAIYEDEFVYTSNKKLYVSDKKYDVPFKSIQTYLKYQGYYFICPEDENAKIIKLNIQDGTSTEISLPFDTQGKTWNLKCVLYSGGPIIFVSALRDQGIYPFRYDKEEWDLNNDFRLQNMQIPEFYIYKNELFFFEITKDNKIYFQRYKISYTNEVLGITRLQNSKDYGYLQDVASFSSQDTFKGGIYVDFRAAYGYFQLSSKPNKVYLYNFDINNNQCYNGRASDKLTQYFDENSCVFKAFHFINYSQYFFFQYESSSWGVGDFYMSKVIFENKKILEGFYAINDIKRENYSFIIKMDGKYYRFCPFASSYDEVIKCEVCSESKNFIIDSLVGNYCYEIPSESKNNFEINEKIATCSGSRFFVPSTGTCESLNANSNKYFKIPDGIFIDKEDCVNGEIESGKCKNCAAYFKYYNTETKLCSDLVDGYYVINQTTLKKCNESCKTCKDSSSCLVCADGYFQSTKTKLCVDGSGEVPNSCDGLWYEKNEETVCIQGNSCPKNYGIITTGSKECILCKKENLFFFKGQCLENCPTGYKKDPINNLCTLESQNDKPEQSETCNLVIKNVPSFVVDSNIEVNANKMIKEYAERHPQKGETEIVFGKYISLLIYQSFSCALELSLKKGIAFANITNVVNNLKKNNDALKNEDLIVGQIELERENETTSQITGFIVSDGEGESQSLVSSKGETYEIYHPLPKIDSMSKAEKMSEIDVDIYNPEDPFFNDFCFPYYNENNKDVSLADRRNDYFENTTFCQEGCDYLTVDFKSAKISCSCILQETIFDKINSNMPLEDFQIDIDYTNLIVVRCYNLVFNMEYFLHNLGGWIIIMLFIGQVVITIHFFLLGFVMLQARLFNKIKNNTKKQSNIINRQSDINIQSIGGTITNSRPNPPRKKRKNSIELSSPIKSISSCEKLSSPVCTTLSIRASPKFNLEKKTLQSGSKLSLNDLTDSSSVAKSNVGNHHGSCIVISTTKPIKETVEFNKEEEEEIEEDELNKLDFEDALIKEKRSFFKFYCDLLLDKLEFTSTCMNFSPFEPIQIRIISLLLILSFYLVFNAMFYDDNYISKRYQTEDTGFVYILRNELKKSAYASLCIFIVGILADYATSFKRRFEVLFSTAKTESEYTKESRKIFRRMKIRIALFLVVNFIIIIAFWYYVSAFCAVYQKNQVSLVISCFITFCFCSILQVIAAFLITSLRYIGLKCNISCLYTLSRFFV